MWFALKGDERLGQCVSDGCGGQPTWRMEAGGVGSNYCSGCKEKIELDDRKLFDAIMQRPETVFLVRDEK